MERLPGHALNGEQTKAASRTNAIRIDAARSQGLAEAQKEVDVATFVQWVDAYAHGETELTTFYARPFAPSSSPRSQPGSPRSR